MWARCLIGMLLLPSLACGRAGFFVDPFDGGVVLGDADSVVDATPGDVVGADAASPDSTAADVGSGDAVGGQDAGLGRDAGSADVGLSPLALLSSVRVSADQVLPAQQGVQVVVRVDNLGFDRLDLIDVSLRFTRQNSDLGSFFVQHPRAENARGIDAAQSVWLTFAVDVVPLATAGPVTVDARVQVRSSASGQVQFLNRARVNDTLEIIVPAELRVSTIDDEDDIGGGQPTLAAAGGLGDLSLREAIVIANAASGPQSIHFDPGLFAPGSPRTIVVDPALGELPALRAVGVRIDASDAGVKVKLDDAVVLTGLRVQADDVTLSGFVMSGFGGDDRHYCVDAEQVFGLTLQNMLFESCGFDDSYGGQVNIAGGGDHLILSSVFRAGPRDGMRLSDSPQRVRVEGCAFVDNGDDGLTVSGTDIQVTACDFIDNRGEGIEVWSFDHLLVRGSLLQGSGYYRGEAGIDLRVAGQDARILNNVFQGNKTFDVRLGDSLIQGVELAGNRFEHFHGGPIFLEPGANQGVQPPTISVFDGQHVEGTVASDVDRIELFDGRAGLLPITQISVLGGLFSLDLSTTVSHIAATGTTAGGSTSAFSAVVSPPTAALVVSTTSDELDGGPGIVTVAQAGGPADLSLREAITIAANRRGPDAITFDTSVFLPGVETSVAVGSGSDPAQGLPSLGDGDSLVAGSSRPVLDGGTRVFASQAALLGVDGDAARVQGLTFRSFLANQGRCLAIRGDDLVIRDNSFGRCGTPATGSGLAVEDVSRRALIDNNHFLYSKHGLDLYALYDSVVQNNRVEQTSGSCIYAREVDHNVIADNVVGPCGRAGLKLGYGCDDNVIIGLHAFACGEAGLHTTASGKRNSIFFSTLLGNRWGVWVHRDMQHFIVQNSLLAYSAEDGLFVDTGQTVQEDHNLFFDNDDDGMTGARARSDGVALAPSDLLVDPGLANWATGQMTPNASTVDQGMDLGYDRNGLASGLYNGSAPDIGAVEQ